jgi:membrane-associated protease RseP (regulator of RpoE activity)
MSPCITPLIRSRAALFLAGAFLVLWSRAAADPPQQPAPKTENKNRFTWVSPFQIITDWVEKEREAAARAQVANNLRQLSLAVQKYEAQNRWPAVVGVVTGPAPFATGGPIFFQYTGPKQNEEWFKFILPYVEQDNLYQQYSLNPNPTASRLGAQLEQVSGVLASQLGLPKGKGQVIGQVTPKSAADKAGLQQHDILLELDGKSVSSDAAEFAKAVAAIKANTPVGAVVLRQGKRTEVKKLSLPEPSAELFPGAFKTYLAPVTDGTSNTIMFGEGQFKAVPPDMVWNWYDGTPRAHKEWSVRAEGKEVLTTTFRRQERFTTRLQEGTLIITVTGALKDGKTTVIGIKVQDSGVEKKYASLDKVPEEYRDKAAHLIDVSGKAQGAGDSNK